MSAKTLMTKNDFFSPVFNDFFKPWNQWFEKDWGNMLSVPAVNATESKDDYTLTVAAPGLKKDDFKIDVSGNMLTISSETEEKKDEKEEDYTRREYNYSSFSRSFTLPDEVNREKIDASYENGILKLVLPKKEEAKKGIARTISVK